MSKNFESALKDLNTLVEKMEKGNTTLENLLKQFEQGINLIQQCQTLLKSAEQKIEIYQKSKNSLADFPNKKDIKLDESDQ